MKSFGFTLVEILIYFTVLTLVIFASVNMALEFGSIKARDRERQSFIQSAYFLEGKLDSILGESKNSSITNPPASSSGSSLVIVSGAETITVSPNGSNLELTRQTGAGTQVNPITNSHVTVSNFSVSRQIINGVPGVTIGYTLDSRLTAPRDFQTIFYPVNL